jgi:signal transduction histidine kinase
VIGCYTLIVVGVGTQLRVQGDLVLSLIATGVVAVAFNPLHRRLQQGVNRLLYGQRNEPYAVVAQLGNQLASPVTRGPADLLQAITQTIGQTLKLPYVAVETMDELRWATEYQEPASRPYANSPEQQIIFPLVYQGKVMGAMRVAARAGETLRATDRELLQELARQVGVVVHAAHATVELQRARERIVTAREEERRRIRRDLHDGLGPQLASQSLKLETAREFVATEPERAQALLDELIGQAQNMVGEIRRLVYALRPPALDDLGLLGALHDVAARVALPGLQVEIVPPTILPPLPAAVEVATYRIVQEAIVNVVKHARAGHCMVQLAVVTQRMPDDTLIIEIVDDGMGVASNAASGVGMHSMRERAEELGGLLTISSTAGQGTVVRAELPILFP